MRDADLLAIGRAIEAENADALAAASARIGLAMPLPAMVQLRKMLYGTLKLSDVLLAIHQALTNETGIVLVELDRNQLDRSWRSFDSKVVCLVVRHGGALTVGIKPLRNVPMTVVHAWPVLRPWFKEVRKNRGRAEQWAESDEPDRVRIPIIASPVTQGATDDERALIATLVDNPDDLDARLVLADRLLEREDARGELLRLDLQLRALANDDPTRHVLQARIDTLTTSHGQRLAGDVADLATDYSIWRGFVDGVTMTAGAFKKHGERLFREQPIRELTVKPWNDAAVATLAQCPHLVRVRSLKLKSAGRGSERVVSIAPLAASPFDRLELLQLRDTITTGPDGEAFFSGLRAPRLRGLDVLGGFLGAGGLRGLAANHALCAGLELVGLTQIHARCNGVELEPDALEIAQAALMTIALPKLRKLDLYDCWFGSEDIVARFARFLPGYSG